MANNVIRKDVVQLDFVTNLKELTKVTDGIDDLKKSVKGGVGDDEFEKLKDSANDSVNPLKKVKEQAEKVTKAVSEIGKKAATTAFNGLKKLAGITFKATIAGLAATTAAVGKLVASSIAAYADFEQLVGGVETLFGAKGARSVEEYAKMVGKPVDKVQDEFEKLRDIEFEVIGNGWEAFKTAGISVNDYLDTVTSFSASLIQSCGGDTKKAAELADVAIKDMSDNANKMGSDMESLQNAYSGFAKQNYTMLDNLKLGYGGTKEEMERLIKDAAKIDKSVKANDMSYANIVKAIHAVQIEMSIYGTTAKEAENTISGSLNMTKAAWQNLLVSFMEGGDAREFAIEGLVHSIKALAKNLMPAILDTLDGIGSLIEEASPYIEKHLPTVIDKLLPPLIKAAAALLAGLVRALPGIITVLVKELPGALKIVWDSILDALGEQFPILYKIGDWFKLVFEKIKGFFQKYGGTIKSIAKGFIDNLKKRFSGLGTIFETTKELFANPPDNITDFFGKIASAAQKLIPAIIGVVGAFKLFKKLKSVTSIFGGSKGKEKSGGGIFGSLVNGLKSIGSIKVGTVLKAMANLGIIIVAFMAFAWLFMEAAPQIASLNDSAEIAQVIIVMGLLGTLGTGMAQLTSKLKTVKTQDVIQGLKDIAVAIGGLTLITAAFALIAPEIAPLIEAGTMTEVGVVMAAVSVVGAAMAEIAGIVGKIKINTVLTGLADIALAIGGMTVITAAFAAIAPHVAPLIEADTMGQVSLVMTGLAALGTVLTTFAGVAGTFPIQTVLTGLGNIALVLGGLTATVAAFGALTKIEGLTELIESGGQLLSDLCGILGDMIGTLIGELVGGVLEGITDSLPAMGEDIADFAQNVSGVFTAFDGVNADSAAKALSAIADFLIKITLNDILSFFTGGTDFSGVASGLASLASDDTTKFFTWVQTIPEAAYTSTTKFFTALDGIGKLEKVGGFIQLFTGNTDYSGISAGLGQLCAQSVKNFFTYVGELPEIAFTNAIEFFKALDGIGLLPNTGGFFQLFTGENDFAGVSTGLGKLCSQNVKNFFTYVSELPKTTFDNATKFFKCLDGIGLLPNVGGFAQLFTGQNDFAGVATGLGKLSSQNVKNFFTYVGELKKATFDNVTKFFKCLDGIGGLPNVGGFAQLFTGQNDFTGVADGLGKFSAQKVKDFFTMVGDMNATTFSNLKQLFQSLSDVGKINKEGFFEQLGELFTGDDNNLGEIASQLANFWNTCKGFITGVANVKDTSGFTKIWDSVKSAISVIETLKSKKYEAADYLRLSLIGAALGDFAESVTPYLNFLAVWQTKTLDKSSSFNKVFSTVEKAGENADVDLSNLPNQGTSLSKFVESINVFDLYLGDCDLSFQTRLLNFNYIFDTISEAAKVNTLNISTLPKKGTQLSEFMENVNNFFVGANAISAYIGDVQTAISALKEFFKTVKTIKETDLPKFKASVDLVFGDVVKTVESSISSMVTLIAELPSKMGTALKENSSALSDAVASMWKDAVNASVAPVNKLLDGANFILGEFGSEKRMAQWKPYAKGTDGHRGGNAIVNDGRGAELVQMPNGRMFIPRGRNVFMPNAPKGMKVLSAENTAKMFGRTSPTFRYADGNIDVWSFIDNASGLIGEITKGISYKGMSNFTASVGKGMVNTFSGAMKPWIEKLFEEFGAKSIADYVASAGVEQWRSTVIKALKMEGLYSEANVQRTLFQMQTESGGNPMAINLWDSNAKKGTPSKGLMQVIDPTFKAYARAGYNTNIYDPLSNILASIRYATARYGSLAKAYRGVGYSNGVGEVTMPSSSVRYSPESSIEGRTSVSEHNTYSPSFNITINGSDDPRESERKVKQWIKEAMEDMFSGMARKNKPLREA